MNGTDASNGASEATADARDQNNFDAAALVSLVDLNNALGEKAKNHADYFRNLVIKDIIKHTCAFSVPTIELEIALNSIDEALSQTIAHLNNVNRELIKGAED